MPLERAHSFPRGPGLPRVLPSPAGPSISLLYAFSTDPPARAHPRLASEQDTADGPGRFPIYTLLPLPPVALRLSRPSISPMCAPDRPGRYQAPYRLRLRNSAVVLMLVGPLHSPEKSAENHSPSSSTDGRLPKSGSLTSRTRRVVSLRPVVTRSEPGRYGWYPSMDPGQSTRTLIHFAPTHRVRDWNLYSKEYLLSWIALKMTSRNTTALRKNITGRYSPIASQVYSMQTNGSVSPAFSRYHRLRYVPSDVCPSALG